jgi:DNA-directed RNA polymerase specialized sigma24 family protein
VALFHGLRHWSYRAIRDHWAPNGLDAWLRVVRDRSGRINRQFPEPLPESEVTSTAKSVGKWTWRNITPAGLQALIERTHTPELQAERGRKSGEARRLSREQERATARLLRAKGYTQQQIADEIGVPQQTISRWLS